MLKLTLLVFLSIIFPIEGFDSSLVDGLPIETGYLSQYDPDLMWHTVLAQQSWGKLPQDLTRYEGFIATPECDIGREGWLSVEDNDWIFVVAADCSGHASTTEWMERSNIIAELSFSLAARYDVVGKGDIEGRIAWLD